MESIQNAYQGFAKQNYTMLDNLKLGYGGTKEEMERLLEDAEKLSNVEYDISSYADIVEAIHVVQEEMGITGTTAEEAASTIQGSAAAMKGAWANFITGIAAGNQDISKLMDNLIESIVTVGKNVVPRIKTVVENAIGAILEVIRGFSEVLPQMFEMGGRIAETIAGGLREQAPALVSAGASAVGSIASAIIENGPEIAWSIIDSISNGILAIASQADKLAEAGKTIITYIAAGFKTIVGFALRMVDDLIETVVFGFLTYHETLFNVGLQAITAIVQGFASHMTEIVQMGIDFIENILEGIRSNLPALVSGAIVIVNGIADALIQNLPMLVEMASQIILTLVDGLKAAAPTIAEAAVQIITTLAFALNDMLPVLIPTIVEIIVAIVEELTKPDNLVMLAESALVLVGALTRGLVKALPILLEGAAKLISNLLEAIVQGFADIGGKIVDGLIGGFVEKWQELVQRVQEMLKSLVDGVKNILGIHSPSKIFSGIGKNMALGLGEGWDNEFSHIKNQIQGGMNFGTTTVDFASSGLAQSSRTVSGGVMSMMSAAQQSGEITIPITLQLDGSVLAHKMYKYNQQENFLQGSPA